MDIKLLSFLISEDIRYNNGLLIEDFDKKLPHLVSQLKSKRSPMANLPEDDIVEFIRDISTYDPTTSKEYMPYMVKQVKFKNIVFPDDGVRIHRTLSKFNEIKTSWMKKDWISYQRSRTDNPLEINRYKKWQELERDIQDFMRSFGTEESEPVDKDMSLEDKVTASAEKGAKNILEINMKGRTKEKGIYNIVFKLYEITNVAAAIVYGNNTNWCTATLSYCYKCTGNKVLNDQPCDECHGLGHKQYSDLDYMEYDDERGWPETAHRYLLRGPLYIITKNDETYLQTNFDWSEFLNTRDDALATCGAALDFFLGKVIVSNVVKPFAIRNIQRQRSLCVNSNGDPIKYKNRVSLHHNGEEE